MGAEQLPMPGAQPDAQRGAQAASRRRLLGELEEDYQQRMAVRRERAAGWEPALERAALRYEHEDVEARAERRRVLARVYQVDEALLALYLDGPAGIGRIERARPMAHDPDSLQGTPDLPRDLLEARGNPAVKRGALLGLSAEQRRLILGGSSYVDDEAIPSDSESAQAHSAAHHRGT